MSESSTDAHLQRFLADRGEDVEACFRDLPAPDTTAVKVHPGEPGAQRAAPPGQVVIAIDASGSMAARAGGGTKMQAAKRAASEFLATLPAGTSVGLLAFGHRGSNRPEDKAASCAATEPVYPVGAVDRAGLDAALAGFDARGWTPLAAAIGDASRMLPANDGGAPQAVYVVSDGDDTCGGDAVAAARTLHASGARPVINIIGFDLPAADRARLEAVADAGGGTFTEVDLDRAGTLADELRRSNRDFNASLRARNANDGTRLVNSNRTFAAGLKLENCVFTRSLKEKNRARAWARERALPEGEAAALVARLEQRHAAQEARAQRLVDQAEDATGAANAAIQRTQEANDAREDASSPPPPER